MRHFYLQPIRPEFIIIIAALNWLKANNPWYKAI